MIGIRASVDVLNSTCFRPVAKKQSISLNDLFKLIVLQMYGEQCVCCGRVAVTVHHLWPKGMGGCSLNIRYNPLNGVPICERCHTRIHSEIGETRGREEIMDILPHLKGACNPHTHPLLGSNEREVRLELMEMWDGKRRAME